MPTDIEQRLRDAYGADDFGPTYADVLARARRVRSRRGWLAPVGAIIATPTVAVGIVIAVPMLRRPDAQQQPAAWDQAFAAGCSQWWARNAPADPATAGARSGLPSRFSFRDGEQGLRLYTDGTLLFACSRDAAGAISGTVRGDLPAKRPFVTSTVTYPVAYLAVLGAAGAPEYLIGLLPTGTDHATVIWALNNRPVAAEVNGGYVAYWSAHGGLENTFIGVAGAGLSRPTYFGGELRADVLPAACQQALGIRLAGTAGVDVNTIINSDPRLTLRDGARQYLFYADPFTMTLCELDTTGQLLAGEVVSHDRVANGSSAIYGQHAHAFAFGRGLAGQSLVELLLADGRTVDAQLSGVYYGATWISTEADAQDPAKHGVVETRIHTPQGVYSNLGGTFHKIG